MFECVFVCVLESRKKGKQSVSAQRFEFAYEGYQG